MHGNEHTDSARRVKTDEWNTRDKWPPMGEDSGSRFRGLGLNLLLSRRDICKAIGIAFDTFDWYVANGMRATRKGTAGAIFARTDDVAEFMLTFDPNAKNVVPKRKSPNAANYKKQPKKKASKSKGS